VEPFGLFDLMNEASHQFLRDLDKKLWTAADDLNAKDILGHIYEPSGARQTTEGSRKLNAEASINTASASSPWRRTKWAAMTSSRNRDASMILPCKGRILR
jgi:hypothetical protein